MFDKFLEILNNLVEQDISKQFKAFALDKLKIIYEQLNYLNSESAKYLEIHKNIFHKFQKIKQIENDETQKFFALSKDVIQSIKVINAREWYEKSCGVLVDNATWWKERLAQLPSQASAPAKARIHQLRMQWQQQGYYTVFSTPDLIGVYWRNVGVIGQWLKLLEKEIKCKNKRPSEVLVRQYQTQFNSLLTAFEAEKARLRASMLARLSVGVQRGDLYCDDLVVATVQELEKLGAMSPMHLPKGVRRHVEPHILSYIQLIIGVDGTPQEKVQLAHILYSQRLVLEATTGNKSATTITPSTDAIAEASTLALRTNHLGITFAVPKAVATIVAVKPPFYTKLPKGLQFLFRGEREAYEFFQHENCQHLLIAQQHFAKFAIESDIKVTTLRHAMSWNYFNQLAKLLASESKRQQSKKASLFSVLYPDVHRILRGYKATLVQFANELFNKQLCVFDLLMTDLEILLQTRKLTGAELFHIEKVAEQLIDFQKSWGIALSAQWQNLLERHEKIKTDTAKPLIVDSTFEQATQVTQKIQKGQKLAADEKALVHEIAEVGITVFSTVPATSDTYARATATLNYRVAQNDAKKLLRIEFAKSGLTLTSQELVEHLQAIKTQVEAIALIEPAFIHSAEIQTAFYRYLYNLLNTIQNLSGRSAFTKVEGHVHFILTTLLRLPIDDILRHIIDQFAQATVSFKTFDWDLFVQIAISSKLNALLDVINTDIAAAIFEENSCGDANVKNNTMLVKSDTRVETPVSTPSIYSLKR